MHAESFRSAVDQVAAEYEVFTQDELDGITATAAGLVMMPEVDAAAVDDLQLEMLYRATVDGAAGEVDPLLLRATRSIVNRYEVTENARYDAMPFEAMGALFYRDRDGGLKVRVDLGDHQVTLSLHLYTEARTLAFDLQAAIRVAIEDGTATRRRG